MFSLSNENLRFSMKRQILALILSVLTLAGFAQTKFRSGIFLHHSTGDNIWGPNGSTTSIPQEMTKYNTSHSLTGGNAVTMNQQWWPDGDNSGNNEWYYWHDIFENRDLTHSDIRPILTANKIVVIKSCFPSSAIDRQGQPSDTLTPTEKTIYNYKWHWRHIIKVMKQHPENFFAIWTDAPMTSGQTDATSAGYSKKFCAWAKDTLAKGNDPVFGAFPKNVYVFDYFSKLTDANGFEKTMYAVSSGDSHPNSAATALVAPQFVSEIFDAALSYENLVTGVNKVSSYNFNLYPNPAKDFITIEIPEMTDNLSLSICNSSGREVYVQKITNQLVKINISKLAPDIYFIKISDGKYFKIKKVIKED